MTVDNINPSAPARATKNRPLHVALTLTNHTDTAISGVRVTAERGYPITTRTQLQSAGSESVNQPGGGVPVRPVTPVTVTIPADGSVQVTFATTISILQNAGICQCHNAVYPLLFTARRSGSDDSTARLTSVQTFLPVFYQQVPTLKVSWIWPIIDRPHRTTSDTVFDDDDLAASIAAGGRLDRALSVVEQVDSAIPLTLLMDPETLDELQVMSSGPYRVRGSAGSTTGSTTGTTRTVTGTGQASASIWLSRLRSILAARPDDTVALTPYADPDVESLAERRRPWSATLPSAMALRVSTALGSGVTPRTDLAWPAASRIGSTTLTALAGTGVRTVVLDSAGVRTGASTATGPPGVARLSTPTTPVTALLTDSVIEKDISTAIDPTADSSARLPSLLAELAIRVTSTPALGRVTVLTAPRYVDASIQNAVAVIDASSTASFATPAALSVVTGSDLAPDSVSTLRAVADNSVGLRDSVVAAIRTVRSSSATIRSMLTVDDKTAGRETSSETLAAQTTLAILPVSVQRLQSSAWRTNSGVAAAVSDGYSRTVQDYIDRLRSGVSIVQPSTGVYTLASTNSNLPITVKNDLRYPVSVVITVSTVSGTPGFSAKDIGTQIIGAQGKRTVQLPTTVQRSGRFQVQVTLSAPDQSRLGSPLTLTVHSTALGRIGVIITIAAGALLALALLVRTVLTLRRKRRSRRDRSSGGPRVEADVTP